MKSFYSIINGPALSATTTYKPQGQSLDVVLENPNESTVRLSSSATTDTSKSYHIVGYDDSSQLLSEVLSLNASNSRTPVTSSNNYSCITKFYGTVPTNNVGDIYVYNSSASVTNGVPSNCIATIPSGNAINNANINWFAWPSGTSLKINKIIITLTSNTSDHRVNLRQLTKDAGNINGVPNRLVQTWPITKGTNIFDYNPNNLNIDPMGSVKNYLWFEVDFLSGDANARVTIDMHYLME